MNGARTAALLPLLFGALSALLGAPAYLVLAHHAEPPAWLVDRPWPLAVAISALLVGSAALQLRARERTRRRLALGAVVVSAASLVGLHVVSRGTMPASSRDVAIGARLPDVTLMDENGQGVHLSSLREHPTVLVFYRGALCVACRAQLVALADRARPFIEAGVRVFGVSADPPSVSSEWKRTLALPFSLLSDEHQRVAQTLCSARAHCLLLVDPSGVVHWGALNDYWRGAQPAEAVLLAAYRLAARHGDPRAP